MSQPGPNGITLKARIAVKAETIGAMMYGNRIASEGANASL